MTEKHKLKLMSRVHSAFSHQDGSGGNTAASAPVSSRSLFSRPRLNKNPPPMDSASLSDIFERSISNALFLPPMSTASAQPGQQGSHLMRSRSMSAVSSSSLMSQTPYAVPMHHNTEDFVAPCLDTTTEVLSDPSIDMNDVEIVCPCEDDDLDHECAPVRPPVSRSRSRSRSIISTSLRHCINGSNHTAASQSGWGSTSGSVSGSLSGSVSPTMSHVKLGLSIANRTSSFQSLTDKGEIAPSKATINFYSFADMVNAENHTAATLLGPSALDETLQEEDPLYETDEDLVGDRHLAAPSNQETIEKFNGFHMGSPPNKFHRTRSHGSTALGIEPDDSRAGYQSMSLKEYISAVAP